MIIQEEKVIAIRYKVMDNYGFAHVFNNETEAKKFSSWCAEEKCILQLIEPTGVTMLLVHMCPDPWDTVRNHFRGLIGYNGVPFCEVTTGMNREWFSGSLNPVQRHTSIHGDLPTVLLKTQDLLEGLGKVDVYDGAYHYHWDPQYGTSWCVDHFMTGADEIFKYHWDGKQFTTNDPLHSKITVQDFQIEIPKMRRFE